MYKTVSLYAIMTSNWHFSRALLLGIILFFDIFAA
jgi:hypothetical protein